MNEFQNFHFALIQPDKIKEKEIERNGPKTLDLRYYRQKQYKI